MNSAKSSKPADGAYRSEKDGEWLLFIREEPVIS